MIISATITDKSFGSKQLYSNINIEIHLNEKVGIVGRNGTGKSTLFNILTGDDTDFQGEVTHKSGSIVISSRQEHHGHEDKSVLEYIQGDLPEYATLTHIIDTYPETMGTKKHMIQAYSDALERFNELGYYQIETDISQLLDKYQLPNGILHKQLGSLSGGQKRMVELIKVQQSKGHVALIDEPTNHMDYVAKQAFIGWMKVAKEAIVVITHDRDVLHEVDRIIEIKDGISVSFTGNYAAYLRTNTSQVGAQVNQYDVTQRQIENLKQDIIRFRRLKEKARNPGTIRRFKGQEQRAEKELAELQKAEKPSFWIDQESASSMNKKLASTYDKYKATNIKVRTTSQAGDQNGRVIATIHDIQLGYGDTPLFDPVTFTLKEGERIRLHGRNGAGKTTLIRALTNTAAGKPLASTCFSGTIEVQPKISIGQYSQEIEDSYLSLNLEAAIESILRQYNLPITGQKIKQLMGDYLFDPVVDAETPVSQLSGGQKARLQLIAMLVHKPQLLILDEPTNHLDLPSIEELEKALAQYDGAILYVSHDSYFADNLKGQTIAI